MSESSRKERIVADLQQAKQAGELKTDKIREIVKNALAQASDEIKEGRSEISNLVQDAIAAVREVLQDKGEEIKEEITASIEGAIAGISKAKRNTIAKSQSQIQDLQTQIDSQEEELQEQINNVFTDLKEKGKQESNKFQEAIASAIETIKESEESALLQKRYVQLKTQLAVLQANLANHYEENSDKVKLHLDEAKNWYEKAKQDPEVFTEKVAQRQAEFEQKLGEAGSAIAQKEKQIKTILQELWHNISEIFHDKSPKN